MSEDGKPKRRGGRAPEAAMRWSLQLASREFNCNRETMERRRRAFNNDRQHQFARRGFNRGDEGEVIFTSFHRRHKDVQAAVTRFDAKCRANNPVRRFVWQRLAIRPVGLVDFAGLLPATVASHSIQVRDGWLRRSTFPKWMGTPVWSHHGIVCTGEAYTKVVKLTFARGAALQDPARLFNSSLGGNVRRAIDIHEGKKLPEASFKRLVKAAVAKNLELAKGR